MIKNIATMHTTSISGLPLLVVFLPPGTWAGYPAAKSDKPLVEFYDTRYDHTLFGQFTGGRYYADELLKVDRIGRGLALNGSNRDWMISATEIAKIRTWVEDLI